MFAKHGLTTIIIAGVLLSPALAAARPGDGPGRRPDALPIKNRRCIAECRGETSQCLGAVRRAAHPCFEACAPLVGAAPEACAVDSTSDACREAAAAARACLDPCQEALRPLVGDCIAVGHECLRACPIIGETPCLSACRTDHVECPAAVRTAFSACRGDCADELGAARTACAGDPTSDVCAAAKAAAHGCVDPCYEVARAGLGECRKGLRQCVAACAQSDE